MRLLTWNICRGRRNPIPAADALTELDADVLVLTEFRTNTSGVDLLTELRRRGYSFARHSDGFAKSSGVAVVSRSPLVSLGEIGPPDFPHRWEHVSVEGSGIELLGVYLNGSLGPPETLRQKQAFWDRICASAEALMSRRAVIIGDLNTGLHQIDEEGSTFRCSTSFRMLLDRGWIDTFRALHGSRMAYTWWSNRRGFRLDHAFLSPSLAPLLKSAEYVARTSAHVLAHDMPRPWPRELGPALSDHSALVIEIDA